MQIIYWPIVFVCIMLVVYILSVIYKKKTMKNRGVLRGIAETGLVQKKKAGAWRSPRTQEEEEERELHPSFMLPNKVQSTRFFSY